MRITAKIAKKDGNLKRLVPAAAVGGLYSMIILADIPPLLSVIFKILACSLIILLAFRFYRVKSFFLTVLIFIFTNFLFLGIIIGVYLIFKSDMIAVKNGSVYFGIGARGLLLCAFFAYILSGIIIRIYNRRLAKGEVYTLEITNKGKTVTAFALSDTGNRLREPFSNEGVIVVKSEIAKDIFDENRMRLIPASTVNSSSYLKAFKPDKIIVKNSNGKEEIENAYVALSDEMQKDGFSAVLNPEILSV